MPDDPHDHREDDTRQFAAVDGAADAPATRLQAKARSRRRRTALAGRVLATLLATAVFATTATGWAATKWFDSRFREVAALDPASTSIQDAEQQYGDENVLVVGSDTRAGAQAGDDVGTVEQIGGARSDTVMIAHLPADRSRAVIVSFPRDLQVARPACTGWDAATGAYTAATDPGEPVTKLNTAYQVGGPVCVTKVVQQLTGLAITRFVGIDFQGFKSVVDAVGGVRVCVERPLDDAELGLVVPTAGTSVIDGATALDFVRARKVAGDPTGDYGRITRQQRLLSSLLRTVLSPSVLLNPGRLGGVAGALASNTVGENVGTGDLLELARSVQGLRAGRVTFVTVPTTGEANGYGNEELRPQDTAALFRAIIDGRPLPGEQPPSTPPSAPSAPPSAPVPAPPSGPSAVPTAPPAPLLAPDRVRVRVLNGSGTPGAAGQVARELQSVGFGVLETGNAFTVVPGTVVRYPPGREAEARTLAAAVGGAALEAEPAQAATVTLVVGPGPAPVVSAPVLGAPASSSPPPLPADLDTVNAADTACS